MRSGAHFDPLTRQFPAFRSTGRINLPTKIEKIDTKQNFNF